MFAIHAHTINLPLLADFPSGRVDVNPYHSPQFFDKEKWGRLDIEKLSTPNVEEPLLIFLDLHTIANIEFVNLDGYTGEIYLFIGDTQHGPLLGYQKLKRLVELKSIKYIFFVNNPQHAHWFDNGQNNKKFYFIPLGLSNSGIQKNWVDEFVSNEIVHIGTVSASHFYRSEIVNGIQRYGCNVLRLNTSGYSEANSIYKNSLAVLNISLNSDIPFRLAEAAVSGAVVISDKLGTIQRSNLIDFNMVPDLEFSGLDDLFSKINNKSKFKDFCKEIREKKMNFLYPSLKSLKDLVELAKPIKDLRYNYWSTTGWGSADSEKYFSVRDMHFLNSNTYIDLRIESTLDFDYFLYLVDLPRILFNIKIKKEYIIIFDRFVTEASCSDMIRKVEIYD